MFLRYCIAGYSGFASERFAPKRAHFWRKKYQLQVARLKASFSIPFLCFFESFSRKKDKFSKFKANNIYVKLFTGGTNAE